MEVLNLEVDNCDIDRFKESVMSLQYTYTNLLTRITGRYYSALHSRKSPSLREGANKKLDILGDPQPKETKIVLPFL